MKTWSRLFSGFILSMALAHLMPAAVAGVLQRVSAFEGEVPLIDPNDPGSSVIPGRQFASRFDLFDEDEIFGVTSADIDRDILAQINGRTAFGIFGAAAAAGRFGSVGLETFNRLELGSGDFTGAHVVAASDEFVNLTGSPQNATASFIIDGGALQIPTGRGVRADYRLVVGAVNLGHAAMTMNQFDLENLFIFGDNPFLLGGGFLSPVTFGSQGSLHADMLGHVHYDTYDVTDATVNSDLNAVFDSAASRVDIPLSLQSFDLGTMLPGDRMFLFYSLYLETAVYIGGSAMASFSDPFSLGFHNSLPVVTLRPAGAVPEASSTMLLLAESLGSLALFSLIAKTRSAPSLAL